MKRWGILDRLNIVKRLKVQELITENLRQQLEIEQVSNYFAQSMQNHKTVDELLWDITKNCISILNFEDCVIYLKSLETNRLIQKAAWGPKASNESEDEFRGKILSPLEIPLGKGIVGAVAHSGIPEIVADVSKDPRYIKDDEARSSEMAVPIIYKGEVLGVIDSENSKKNFYTPSHLQIVRIIANHCADRIIKIKAEENLHENELKLLRTKNRLTEGKLLAIRSQMNSHFIFNSLNSIQQFILKGEVEEANRYLSQFSKLIRLALQSSDKNYTTLEEELSILHLFLSLEKARFGNLFNYEIISDTILESDEIKIPNMMIQPFVENAIWHGLMHKKGDKNLRVTFSLVNDNAIICEVIDNGIGRKKAMEIKKSQLLKTRNKSFGIQLVNNQIKALNQQNENGAKLKIEDIINSYGEVEGTKVVIQLPIL